MRENLSNMIEIKLEPYSDCIDEMKAIYPQHYEELSRTKQLALNPQYDMYKKLADTGILKMISVRDSGSLIGYILFMIVPDLHYGGNLCAEDIYYLKPEYRGRMIGSRMFKVFEEEAKKLNIIKILVSTKIHKDNSKLLERLGFQAHEKLYVKVV